MDPIKKEYEYFLVLCETPNISRASELLGMQQGSLSKALKKLEDSFQGKLFVRQGRGLRQTELGMLLQKQILKLKEDWQVGLEKDRESLRQVAGRIKIGSHQITAIDILSKVVPRLNEKYSELQLDMVFKTSNLITRDVIEHELDFGFVANPIRHPNLVIKRIRKDFIGLWTKDLKNHDKVIYYNPDMIEVSKVLKKYKDYKHVPVSDYEVLAQFAVQSHGITILPNPVAERYKKLKNFGEKLLEVDICLIYHVDRPRTHTFKKVLEEFKP
ncbi:MAG: hypothetical protein CME70_24120 [Halobacteriovorax sp.]|nr:hypothetical protein [Halobacteriovorax sp.]|tara:strand:+ start:8994 stop:9806 length:813 start_codon:yes stop_codon:yes gene_type:complete